jgi:hypothetical protein
LRARGQLLAVMGAITQEKIAFAGAHSKNRAGSECGMQRLNG